MRKAGLLLLFTFGCNTIDVGRLEPRAPRLPEPPLPSVRHYVPEEGSLWQGDASRRFLAFENRAKSVGDLITVEISEQAIAENEATTELSRDSKYEATLDSDIALQTIITRPIRNLLGLLGFTNQKTDKDPDSELAIIKAKTKSEFEGEGSMKREASFITTIACIITEITPSGLLRIEGERHLSINRDTQIIRISGYVRPEDVKINNTVSSTLIANADIYYGGVGLLAEQQRAPWMKRLLDVVLPF